MQATLSITSSDLTDEVLQSLTRDLCTTLNRETEIKAALLEQAGSPGNKGEPITLGTIVMTFLTSGVAVALIEVLRTYAKRNASLQFKIQRKEGKKLTIRAENLSSEKIDQTIELAREFLEG